MSSNTQDAGKSADEFDVLSTPIHIRNIVIEGETAVNKEFIIREVSPVRAATTYEEARDRLLAAVSELKGFDVFKHTLLTVDKVEDPSNEHAVDIIVGVKDKRRFFLSTEASASVDSGSAAGKLTGHVRNLLGRAEKLQASVTTGDVTKRGFHVSLDKPRLAGSRASLNVSAYQKANAYTTYTSFTQLDQGFGVNVRDEQGRHEVGVVASLRDSLLTARHKRWAAAKRFVKGGSGLDSAALLSSSLDSPAPSTTGAVAELGGAWRREEAERDETEFAYLPSPSVVAQVQPSTSVAFHHTFLADERNDPICPRSGSLVRLTTELAGLGGLGDVAHVKATGAMSWYTPLPMEALQSVSLGLSCAGGIIRPFSSFLKTRSGSSSGDEVYRPRTENTTLINDRFFFGGPLSLRGFQQGGVGPSDQNDSLGGELYGAAGVDLSFDLPSDSATKFGIRGHVFANAGNCVSLEGVAGALPATQLKTLVANARVSVGCGIVCPTPIGRLEFNVCHPVQSYANDRTSRFQLGLGLQFL